MAGGVQRSADDLHVQNHRGGRKFLADAVIQKAYTFLRVVQPDQKQADAEKEKAMGEFVLAIRKDLLSRKPVRGTALQPEDFKHFRATELGG